MFIKKLFFNVKYLRLLKKNKLINLINNQRFYINAINIKNNIINFYLENCKIVKIRFSNKKYLIMITMFI